MPKLEIIDRLVDPGVQLCEWPDCAAEGEHRAPRSRDDMDSYRWFCLEHAREYNKGWNYFAGMSDDEVEADRRGGRLAEDVLPIDRELAREQVAARRPPRIDDGAHQGREFGA